MDNTSSSVPRTGLNPEPAFKPAGTSSGLVDNPLIGVDPTSTIVSSPYTDPLVSDIGVVPLADASQLLSNDKDRKTNDEDNAAPLGVVPPSASDDYQLKPGVGAAVLSIPVPTTGKIQGIPLHRSGDILNEGQPFMSMEEAQKKADAMAAWAEEMYGKKSNWRSPMRPAGASGFGAHSFDASSVAAAASGATACPIIGKSGAAVDFGIPSQFGAGDFRQSEVSPQQTATEQELVNAEGKPLAMPPPASGPISSLTAEQQGQAITSGEKLSSLSLYEHPIAVGQGPSMVLTGQGPVSTGTHGLVRDENGSLRNDVIGKGLGSGNSDLIGSGGVSSDLIGGVGGVSGIGGSSDLIDSSNPDLGDGLGSFSNDDISRPEDAPIFHVPPPPPPPPPAPPAPAPNELLQGAPLGEVTQRDLEAGRHHLHLTDL